MFDLPVVLARLRARGDGSASSRLAKLLVDDALARPLDTLVDLDRLAAAIRDGIAAWAASDAAANQVAARIDRATAVLEADERPLRAVLPKPLQDGARAIASLASSTDHDAVRTLIDREPIRKMLRAQVLETLVAFGRKAASPMANNPLARGLGGLSKHLASRPSPLGALASAVSGEVERQIETRAADFADTAVEEIVAGIATQMSDPSKAKEQREARVAMVDAFLELRARELPSLAKGNSRERVDAARVALAAWTHDAKMATELEAATRVLLAADASRTLGELLDDLAIRDAVRPHAEAALEEAIARVVATDAFAAWIGALVAP